MKERLTVHFDGAANLGERAGWGFIVKQGKSWLHQDYGRVPCNPKKATCNTAEHYALGQALLWLHINEHHKYQINVFGDSKLVIKQMQGKWRVKDKTKPYASYADQNLTYLPHFQHIRFRYVPREQNEDADHLSQLGKRLSTQDAFMNATPPMLEGLVAYWKQEGKTEQEVIQLAKTFMQAKHEDPELRKALYKVCQDHGYFVDVEKEETLVERLAKQFGGEVIPT